MSIRRRRMATRTHARRHKGSTLLEVLVSVLIFSFGILGMVGLQARATQLSVDAEDRNRAAMFADELAAQMRLQRRVDVDTVDWEKRVRGEDVVTGDPTGLGLPNAVPTMTHDTANNSALIEIEWRHPRQAAGQESRLSLQVRLTAEEVTP